MPDLAPLGRLLLVAGLLLALAGGLLLLGGRLPGLGWLGRLPGDIVLRRGPVTIYLPIVTSILLSLLLTLILALFFRR
jgi:hypothetical protein